MKKKIVMTHLPGTGFHPETRHSVPSAVISWAMSAVAIAGSGWLRNGILVVVWKWESDECTIPEESTQINWFMQVLLTLSTAMLFSFENGLYNGCGKMADTLSGVVWSWIRRIPARIAVWLAAIKWFWSVNTQRAAVTTWFWCTMVPPHIALFGSCIKTYDTKIKNVLENRRDWSQKRELTCAGKSFPAAFWPPSTACTLLALYRTTAQNSIKKIIIKLHWNSKIFWIKIQITDGQDNAQPQSCFHFGPLIKSVLRCINRFLVRFLSRVVDGPMVRWLLLPIYHLQTALIEFRRRKWQTIIRCWIQVFYRTCGHTELYLIKLYYNNIYHFVHADYYMIKLIPSTADGAQRAQSCHDHHTISPTRAKRIKPPRYELNFCFLITLHYFIIINMTNFSSIDRPEYN